MEIKSTYSDNITGSSPKEKYRSQRYTVEVTKTILSKEEPGEQAALLFQIARSAVRAEVERENSNQAFKTISINENNNGTHHTASSPNNFNGNGNNGVRGVTSRQLKYIFELSAKIGMKSEQANQLANQFNGKAVLTQLTSSEASQLIESLNTEVRKAA